MLTQILEYKEETMLKFTGKQNFQIKDLKCVKIALF